MKKAFLYLFLLVCFGGNAQQFQYLPLDNEIQAKVLFEDSNELLWLGTSKGVFSYDGLSFKQYATKENIENQSVTAIYEDRQKLIWVGYENGNIEFMDIKRELKTFNPEEGLPQVKITGFCEDEKGQLWFSTYGEGVYYYNGKHLYNINVDDGLPSNEVYSITFLNGIWIGTDSGLSYLSKENPKKIINYNTENGLFDNIVQKVVAKNNVLKVSTFDLTQHQAVKIVEGQPLFEKISLWENSKQFETQKTLTYFEGKHTLWVLTDKGIWADYFYENIKVEHLKFNAQVYCDNIQYDGLSSGEFIGTNEGLYFRNFKDSTFKKIELFKNQKVSISCIGQDENFNYIGTFQHGLFILAKQTQKVIKNLTKKNGLCDNAVLSIYGNIFSTIGGLYELTPSLNILDVGKKHSLSIKYLYSIFKDKNQTIWLGTDGEGVIAITSAGIITHFNQINGKELKTVYQINQNSIGNLFFATPDNGLVEFDEKKQLFKIYNTQNGLKSNNINGFKILNDNEILLSHDKNIELYDFEKQKALPFYHPILDQFYEANLNILDQFHPTIILKNFFFHFDPKKIIKPKVHFHNIKNLNQTIDYQKDTIFTYDKNFFIFELTGIYYPKPDEIRFRYKLEGFDRDWIDTKDHNIIYPQLPYGTYKFRAKAIIGNYPSEEIVFRFTITPPFWKTWWFISGLLISFFLGIYLIIKTRENRLRKKAKLEQDKVLAQYEAIRSQINPHFLFNTFNTLIAIIEENPNKAVSFVEKLSDFFRIILEYRDQKTITIQEEVKLVTDYIYILKERFEDNLLIKLDLDNINGNIAPLTLQMLIENAVKHNIVSKSKPLSIHVFENNNYIVVENNLQLKVNKENSTGFGLESIIKRYELLSEEKIVVEHTADYFRVKIPIQ